MGTAVRASSLLSSVKGTIPPTSLGWITATPRAGIFGGDVEVSQVPGEPVVHMPRSMIPVSLCRQAIQRQNIAFRTLDNVGTHK